MDRKKIFKILAFTLGVISLPMIQPINNIAESKFIEKANAATSVVATSKSTNKNINPCSNISLYSGLGFYYNNNLYLIVTGYSNTAANIIEISTDGSMKEKWFKYVNLQEGNDLYIDGSYLYYLSKGEEGVSYTYLYKFQIGTFDSANLVTSSKYYNSVKSQVPATAKKLTTLASNAGYTMPGTYTNQYTYTVGSNKFGIVNTSENNDIYTKGLNIFNINDGTIYKKPSYQTSIQITPSKAEAENRESSIYFTVKRETGKTYYYTLDGTTPTTSSLKLTSSIVPVTSLDTDDESKITLKVLSVQEEYENQINSSTITFKAKPTIKVDLENPEVTFNKGTISNDGIIIPNRTQDLIAQVSAGTLSYYRYTLDGTDPTESSPIVPNTGSIGIPTPDTDDEETVTLKVKGFNGYSVSEVVTNTIKFEAFVPEKLEMVKPYVVSPVKNRGQAYIYLDSVVPTPIIDTLKTYKNDIEIEIPVTGLDDSAEYWYTLDGKTPAKNTIYSNKLDGDSIKFSNDSASARTMTVKIIGYKDGYDESKVGEYAINIGAYNADTKVTFDKPCYENSDSVVRMTIDSKDSVECYYTVNGETPASYDENGNLSINSNAHKATDVTEIPISELIDGNNTIKISSVCTALKGVTNSTYKVYKLADNEVVEDDVVYSVGDTEVEAVKLLDEARESLTIPETIDGKSVTKIGKDFVYFCELKSLSAPSIEAIDVIGWRMHRLQNVQLPKLKTIKKQGFENVPLTGNVKFDNLESVGELGLCDTKIKRLYLPNVKTIGSSAFDRNETLEYLDLSSLEKATDFFSFQGISGIKVIYLNSDIQVMKEPSYVNSEITPEAIKLTGDYSTVIENAIANWGTYNKAEDENGVKWYVRSGCEIPTTDYTYTDN